MTKHPAPAYPARTGPRVPVAAAVPLCAAAFALPAQRLRDLTRTELAAGGQRANDGDGANAADAIGAAGAAGGLEAQGGPR